MIATTPTGRVFSAARLDQSNAASLGDLVGTWTDGANTFTFGSESLLTFSREVSCDGSYLLSPDGTLDVSFGRCSSDSVSLELPIFRSATAHVVDGSLFLAGDAGVEELLPTGGDGSLIRHRWLIHCAMSSLPAARM